MELTAPFLSEYASSTPEWGYDGLGWAVYQRTYSRPLPEGKNEEWWQTVKRVVEGTYRMQEEHCRKNGLPWSNNKAQRSAQNMYQLIHNFKFLPPGRGLWAQGTEYVQERGSAALNNCAFISTKDIRQDFAYPFCFLMDMSMLGVGVGGDMRGAGTVTLKKPVIDIETHVIEDSREGWVEAVRIMLSAYVGKNPLPGSFDLSQIRPAGEPLKGFGGVSSGAGPLKELLGSLQNLLDGSVGQPISSTEIVDIFNMIGKAVVAGGIRRTAEIMLGSHDDEEFLRLKDPKVHSKELMSHRWASNNSLIVPVGSDYSKYVDQIMENGEPGFFWLENAKNYGRMLDGENAGADPFVLGQNPCGEISLESGEFCNLAEVYPAAHYNEDDFITTLKYAYLYAKTVSLMPTHNLQTNAIIGRNRRIGVSVSGVAQAIQKFGFYRFMHMLDKGYCYLRALDREYSRWMCVPESVKLTTVKPSGTVSLLTGATPGVHFPHAEYYIRNVRFDPWSPLLPVLKKAGYPCTPSLAEDGTTVISFPVREKFFRKGKADVSIWEQLELAAQMQHYWADNSVSVTVTVRPGEEKDLAQALSMYDSRLKSVSILPLKDHGYEQAPYIETTKAAYDLMQKHLKPIKPGSIAGSHDNDETGCTNDSCSIL